VLELLGPGEISQTIFFSEPIFRADKKIAQIEAENQFS
jgi:hypothetical protein